MKFGIWTTPTLLVSCSRFYAPALVLHYSSPAPASAQPLSYSCPAPFKLLSSSFLAPPPVPAQLLPGSALLGTSLAPHQFLPSSCPLSALLCFTLISSAPALLLPCSCFSPDLALLQPYSCPAPAPAHPSLAAFIIMSETKVCKTKFEA